MLLVCIQFQGWLIGISKFGGFSLRKLFSPFFMLFFKIINVYILGWGYRKNYAPIFYVGIAIIGVNILF